MPKASTSMDLVPERGMCGAQNIGKERLTTVCFHNIERPQHLVGYNDCLYSDCYCFGTDRVSVLLTTRKI